MRISFVENGITFYATAVTKEGKVLAYTKNLTKAGNEFKYADLERVRRFYQGKDLEREFRVE